MFQKIREVVELVVGVGLGGTAFVLEIAARMHWF